jgi:hypothetical protein
MTMTTYIEKGGEMMKKVLTIREVMRKYDKTYTQVLYAVSTGRLVAIKVGWIWLFPPDKLPNTWPEPNRKHKKRDIDE